MGKGRKKNKMSAVDRLEAVYARIPRIECQGYCFGSCGPIGMSELEFERLKTAAGETPTTVGGLTCSLLRQGRCSAYESRPLICRLWGVAEGMECPWKCRIDGRMLTQRECAKMVGEVDRISGGVSKWTQPPEETAAILRMINDEVYRRANA